MIYNLWLIQSGSISQGLYSTYVRKSPLMIFWKIKKLLPTVNYYISADYAVLLFDRTFRPEHVSVRLYWRCFNPLYESINIQSAL